MYDSVVEDEIPICRQFESFISFEPLGYGEGFGLLLALTG
jgi:hypothetical protein